jgi:hypothetical protein
MNLVVGVVQDPPIMVPTTRTFIKVPKIEFGFFQARALAVRWRTGAQGHMCWDDAQSCSLKQKEALVTSEQIISRSKKEACSIGVQS